MTTPPPSVGVASSSRRATLWTTIVYCWRSSSASANRNGSSRCWQNSAMVQKKGATPVGREPTWGVALASPGWGGGTIPQLRHGPGGERRGDGKGTREGVRGGNRG